MPTPPAGGPDVPNVAGADGSSCTEGPRPLAASSASTPHMPIPPAGGSPDPDVTGTDGSACAEGSRHLAGTTVATQHMPPDVSGTTLGPSGAEPLRFPATYPEFLSSHLGKDNYFCEFPFPPDFSSTDKKETGGTPIPNVGKEQAGVTPGGSKHPILDHLWANGGFKLSVRELCIKYEIPLEGTDDDGGSCIKSEEDLMQDIEFHLELEQQAAWLATNQASAPMCSPEARVILSASGISPATKSIVLTNEDLLPIRKGWGPSLCGMFAGRFPGKEAVRNMTKRWNVPVKTAFHRKGWIIFSFTNTKDMELVRENGPHSIFGIPLVLEPTPEDFDLKRKMKVNVPIWIRLPDLPLSLWNNSAIGKIASSVGTPVMVDECTILRDTLDGARVQVVINVLDEPRKNIEIILPGGGKITQEIVYEALPKYCRICQEFGHYGAGCPGPEEREKIRRANYARTKSVGKEAPRARDASRGRNGPGGRDMSVGTANPKRSQNVRDPSRPKKADPRAGKVDPKVWQPSGRLVGDPSGSGKTVMPLATSNQFSALADENPDAALSEGVEAAETVNTVSAAEGGAAKSLKGKNVQTPVEKSGYELAKADLVDAGYVDPAHELMMAGYTNVPNDSFEIVVGQAKEDQADDSEDEGVDAGMAPPTKQPIRPPLRDPDVDAEDGDADPFPPLGAAVAHGAGRRGRRAGSGRSSDAPPRDAGVCTRERSKSRGRPGDMNPPTQVGPTVRNRSRGPKSKAFVPPNRPLDESTHTSTLSR